MPVIGNLIVVMAADSAKFEQSMQSARRRLKETQTAIQELQRGGLDRLAAGMTFATTQQARWQQLSAQGSINLQQLRTGTENVTRAVDGGVEGFRKFENALIDIGLRAVGVDGKIGRLTEGLLLMGVGGAVTLGVTAGLAIIGYAMTKLGEETKKAHDEYTKYMDSLRDKTPLAIVGAELDVQRAKLAALKRVNEDATRGSGQADPEFEARIARQQSLVDGLNEQYKKLFKTLHENARKDITEVLPGTRQGVAVQAWADARAIVAAAQWAAAGVITTDRNLGALRDRARQGATAEEEAAATARANRGGLSDAMRGVGGERDLGRVEALAKARQIRMAAFTREVWISAARNIQSSVADTFESIFNGQVKSLGDFARSVVQIVQRAIAEILAAKAAAGIGAAIGGFIGDALAGGTGAPGGATSLPSARAGGLRASPSVTHNITVPITVNAFDARGAAAAVRALEPLIGRAVLKGIRNDSGFALATRGQ